MNKNILLPSKYWEFSQLRLVNIKPAGAETPKRGVFSAFLRLRASAFNPEPLLSKISRFNWNRYIQIFIFLLLFLAHFGKGEAHEIAASLSQSKVGINDTFSLIFTSHQNQTQPDFSPLSTDFDILSTNQEQSVSMINGKVTRQNRWNLTLIAKREGEIEIPSIQFGSSTSEPLKIVVTASSSSKSSDTLFIETDIHPTTSLFEQSQLLYTIRIYTTQDISQATLSEIKTNDPDAIIERLGNDIQYEHFHDNGQQYIVLERKYAIFPQHAGILEIAPVTFQAKIVIGGHSFFNVQTQMKRLVSEAMKIEVKPTPLPFTKQNWFAAHAVTWSEEWSADPNNMTLGEPLTWTLTIKADGCMGNQIPTPSLEFPNAFKQYVDKVETSNQITEEGFSGTKQIKVALIATKSGEFSIPKISIDWWDLKSDLVRHMEIPERTIHVASGQIAIQTEQPLSTPNPLNEPVQNATEIPYSPTFWGWMILAMSVPLLIFIGWLFLFKKSPATKIKSDSLNQVRAQIKKACQANDAKKVEVALLAWGVLVYPHLKPVNMTKIKQKLPQDLQEAIDQLYQALYSQQSDWSGDKLWKAWCAFNPHKDLRHQSKKESEKLKELYPF